MKRFIIIVTGLALASGLVACSQTDEPATRIVTVTESAAPGSSVDANLELMRDVWNSGMTASDQAAICDYYNTPPVGVTSDMVRVFSDASGLSRAESYRLLTVVLAEEC